MTDAILAALAEIDITPDPAQLRRLERYAALLLAWNEKVNLTAVTAPDDVAKKHFADSLLGMRLIPQNARCIDVGTGAGFPGAPLCIFRPDVHMTLLDSLNKRVIFLRELTQTLELRAECVHARAEDAARTALRESFDTALARAVAPLPVLCEYLMPFAAPGACCLFYKGKGADVEADAARGAIERLGGGAVTIARFAPSWGERSVIRLQKARATPQQYPRRAGLPEKKPLQHIPLPC